MITHVPSDNCFANLLVDLQRTFFQREFTSAEVKLLNLEALKSRIADEILRLQICIGQLDSPINISPKLFDFYDQFDPFDAENLSKLEEWLSLAIDQEEVAKVRTALEELDPHDPFSVYPFNWVLFQFLSKLDQQLHPPHLGAKEKADQLLRAIFIDVASFAEEFDVQTFLEEVKRTMSAYEDGNEGNSEGLDLSMGLRKICASKAWEAAADLFDAAFPETSLPFELQAILDDFRPLAGSNSGFRLEGEGSGNAAKLIALLANANPEGLGANLQTELERLDDMNPISWLILKCSLYGFLLEVSSENAAGVESSFNVGSTIRAGSTRLGWKPL